MREEDPASDAALRSTPLVRIERVGDGAPAGRGEQLPSSALPLRGIRVIDLTRVIAGPVSTRTLGSLGADVLRIDPPHMPEPGWQHLDTGHGKRSALLDAHDPRMPGLLARADVIVLGYRPAALARLGLSPANLAAQHPHLVIAQLSAWGDEQPERGGFDSLVQAESGIDMIESPDGATPGVLPAQALDHSAGYLLAASVFDALARRRAARDAADGGASTGCRIRCLRAHRGVRRRRPLHHDGRIRHPRGAPAAAASVRR
ncbi:CoA transferase [uncultured Microbacterium sp.]|uniref:CoA transferase n=1 Tax=uncultured Microbacterium sp. TaxID=191216 RepID=UPI00261A636A|nr:CoA transferase [uncultured Microbacterium sp.]